MTEETKQTTQDGPPPIPHLPAGEYVRARGAFIRFCKTYGLDARENPLRSAFISQTTENEWLLWQAAWLAALEGQHGGRGE